MEAKKDLARRIVTDFHSAEAAAKAAEDWAKQFQKAETPGELEAVDVSLSDVALEGQGGGAVRVVARDATDAGGRRLVRIDKLIRRAGLATSNTEAVARLREGAVSMDGESVGSDERLADMPTNLYTVLRVGRRMKRVRLVDNGSKRPQ